jgi:hypothetical protein
MDVFRAYEKLKAGKDLGSDRVYLSSRERIHASMSELLSHSKELQRSAACSLKFSELLRYVTVKGLDYDLFMSIFDVNSTQAMLMRITSPLGKDDQQHIVSFIKKLGRHNLEFRAIGMQNADTSLLNEIEKVHKLAESITMEIDLFGNNTRHLAFDTKSGMIFDILLNDRFYKPGELATRLTLEEFNKQRSKLEFK